MNLLEKRDRLLALPALESRMALLEEEIQEAENDLSKLLQQYNQENRSVERLEKESLSTFLLRLINKHEDTLKRKKHEEINAKLAYDNAATHLNNLTQEKHELASRITPLKAEEKAFRAELESRRAKITRQLSEPQGIRYTELENEQNAIILQITKLKEALRVTALAISSAQKIAASLDKADLAKPNTSSNGLSMLLDIHSHLDDAEQNFHILSSQMRELKSELRGVNGLHFPNLSEMLSPPINIEFVFNHLSRMYDRVQTQVQDKAQEISQVLNNLRSIESELTSKLKELEDAYTNNRRSEEELLLSIS